MYTIISALHWTTFIFRKDLRHEGLDALCNDEAPERRRRDRREDRRQEEDGQRDEHDRLEPDTSGFCLALG